MCDVIIYLIKFTEIEINECSVFQSLKYFVLAAKKEISLNPRQHNFHFLFL